MRASKQMAAKALEAMMTMKQDHHVSTFHGNRWLTVVEFIEAATKALPTQAAIDRDRIRKKDRPQPAK